MEFQNRVFSVKKGLYVQSVRVFLSHSLENDLKKYFRPGQSDTGASAVQLALRPDCRESTGSNRCRTLTG